MACLEYYGCKMADGADHTSVEVVDPAYCRCPVCGGTMKVWTDDAIGWFNDTASVLVTLICCRDCGAAELMDIADEWEGFLE